MLCSQWMLQAHWGSCTSIHPLLYVNEHNTIICRNTAATAHRSIISSISLRQYITLFIFPYFYQFLFCCETNVRPHIHHVCVMSWLSLECFPVCLCWPHHTGHTHCMGHHTSPTLHRQSILLHIPNLFLTAPGPEMINEDGRITSVFSKYRKHTDGPRRNRMLRGYSTPVHCDTSKTKK